MNLEPLVRKAAITGAALAGVFLGSSCFKSVAWHDYTVASAQYANGYSVQLSYQHETENSIAAEIRIGIQDTSRHDKFLFKGKVLFAGMYQGSANEIRIPVMLDSGLVRLANAQTLAAIYDSTMARLSRNHDKK